MSPSEQDPSETQASVPSTSLLATLASLDANLSNGLDEPAHAPPRGPVRARPPSRPLVLDVTVRGELDVRGTVVVGEVVSGVGRVADVAGGAEGATEGGA